MSRAKPDHNPDAVCARSMGHNDVYYFKAIGRLVVYRGSRFLMSYPLSYDLAKLEEEAMELARKHLKGPRRNALVWRGRTLQ